MFSIFQLLCDFYQTWNVLIFFCLPWVNMIRSHRWLSHSLFLSNFLPASLILNNPLQFFPLVMAVVQMKFLLGVTGLAHKCIHNWKGLKAVWWQGYIISDPSVTGTQTSWSSLPSSKQYCLFPPLIILSSVSQMTSNPTCLPVSSVLTWHKGQISEQAALRVISAKKKNGMFQFSSSYCGLGRGESSLQPISSPRIMKAPSCWTQKCLLQKQSSLPISNHHKENILGTNHLGVPFSSNTASESLELTLRDFIPLIFIVIGLKFKYYLVQNTWIVPYTDDFMEDNYTFFNTVCLEQKQKSY